MSRNAKAFCLILSLALLAGGAALCLQGLGGGIAPIVLGVLILIGLALEPRYGRPQGDGATPDGSWRRTGERFVDDESGDLVEVWYDAASGRRRYVSQQPKD
jgi:hypothetical protein